MVAFETPVRQLMSSAIGIGQEGDWVPNSPSGIEHQLSKPQPLLS